VEGEVICKKKGKVSQSTAFKSCHKRTVHLLNDAIEGDGAGTVGTDLPRTAPAGQELLCCAAGHWWTRSK